MKDQDTLNEVWAQEMWEDFDMFVANENWSDAMAVIQAMGDAHYENDAIRMHHVLNTAKNLGYVEPVSQENIPTLRPEETDAEVLGVFSDNDRDDRFLNSKDI